MNVKYKTQETTSFKIRKNGSFILFSLVCFILFGSCSFTTTNKINDPAAKKGRNPSKEQKFLLEKYGLKPREGKFITVSDSENYGLWFSSKTTDPRIVLSSLKQDVNYHIISHPGEIQKGISLVVMHWNESSASNEDELLNKLLEDDNNEKIIYGPYTNQGQGYEPFDIGKWIDADKVDNSGSIRRKWIEKINEIEFQFVVTDSNYLIKKHSFAFDSDWVGKVVTRYFLHCVFVGKNNFTLEIIMPIKGQLEGFPISDFDKSLETRRKNIIQFITDYLVVFP